MYIQTSGARFSYEALDHNEINIVVIARALSHLARFNGHTAQHLSVAQHCIGVACYLLRTGASKDEILAGLLHDAHEAFFGDMPTPLKAALGARVKEFEDRIQHSVAEKLGVSIDVMRSGLVKLADLVALLAERNALLPKDTQPWAAEKHVTSHQLAMFGLVKPWSVARSYFTFLWLYEKLTGATVTPVPTSGLQAIAYRWYSLQAYRMICGTAPHASLFREPACSRS